MLCQGQHRAPRLEHEAKWALSGELTRELLDSLRTRARADRRPRGPMLVSPAHRRRPHPALAQDGLGGQHASSPFLAAGAAREAGRPDAAPPDQCRDLPRGAGPACSLARPWIARRRLASRSRPTRPLTSALDRSARSPGAFAEVCSRPAPREVGTRPPGGSEAPRHLLLLTPRYPRGIKGRGTGQPVGRCPLRLWGEVRRGSMTEKGGYVKRAFVPPMLPTVDS